MIHPAIQQLFEYSAATQQDQSFLRFRRFTGATALGLEYQLALEGYSNGEIRSSYHLCHELLTDCDLTDQKYVTLLIKAFQACQHACFWRSPVSMFFEAAF